MAKIAITLPSTKLVELTSIRTRTKYRAIYRTRMGGLGESDLYDSEAIARLAFPSAITIEPVTTKELVYNGSGGFLAVYKSEDGTPFTGNKAYATDDEATGSNSKAIGAVNVQEYLEVAKKGAIEALDHYLRGLVTLG